MASAVSALPSLGLIASARRAFDDAHRTSENVLAALIGFSRVYRTFADAGMEDDLIERWERAVRGVFAQQQQQARPQEVLRQDLCGCEISGNGYYQLFRGDIRRLLRANHDTSSRRHTRRGWGG